MQQNSSRIFTRICWNEASQLIQAQSRLVFHWKCWMLIGRLHIRGTNRWHGPDRTGGNQSSSWHLERKQERGGGERGKTTSTLVLKNKPSPQRYLEENLQNKIVFIVIIYRKMKIRLFGASDHSSLSPLSVVTQDKRPSKLKVKRGFCFFF